MSSSHTHERSVEEETAFIAICLQIARNDPKLSQLVFQTVTDRVWHWTGADFMLLGKSLLHNTNLDFIKLSMDPDQQQEICKFSTRSANALRLGIANSKLRVLHSTHTPPFLQKIMIEGMKLSSTIRNFNILTSTFTEMRALCKFLLRTPPLEEDGILPPITSPPTMTPCFCRLEHLGLQSCKLNDMDLLALSLCLTHNRCLESLYVEDNFFTNVGVLYFVSHWSPDSPLNGLRIGWNQIGAMGAKVLCEEISKYHPGMQLLSLKGNHLMGQDGLARIGELLPLMSITHLDISVCCIDDTSSSLRPASPEDSNHTTCTALANGLRGNTTLESLYIGANQFGARGTKCIMEAVAGHPSLRQLSFENDPTIGYKGLKDIANELPKTRLQSLNVNGVVASWHHKSKRARETGQALVQGVRDSAHLTQFTCGELDPMWMDPIQFYTALNQTCRPLLRGDAISPAVWPHVLAHFLLADDKMNYAYFCIREQPGLVPQPK